MEGENFTPLVLPSSFPAEARLRGEKTKSYTPTSLERAVLATVTYFDLFSYPVTPLEIWKWMYTDTPLSTSLADVFSVLATSPYLRDKLSSNEGFYFLHGKSAFVQERKSRYVLSQRKFARAKRAVRWFRLFPGVRAVAVCNSLGYGNGRDEGDVDFVVITAPGRIWTARLFVTGFAALMRWRPTPAKTRDAVCLSYFIAEDALDLRNVRSCPDDVHMRYWLDQMVPLYDPHRLFVELRQHNAWTRDVVPHAYGCVPAHQRRVGKPHRSALVSWVLGLLHKGALGNTLEQRSRLIQQNILPAKLRDRANKNTDVVMNDHVLKFHDNDRRVSVLQQFLGRLAEVA